MATAELDVAKPFRVHFLDMGNRKYGDCIFVECGEKTVLIDGGHAGDQNRSSGGHRSIPEQLEKILKHPPPFDISLLVVTHAHSDHIGCLPALVGKTDDDAVVRAEWALVCDPDLGWGRIKGSVAADGPPASDATRVLAAALREETWADVRDDAEVQEFLDAAVNLEDRYRAMLERLKERGTKVERYTGRKSKPLLKAFEEIGLTILGPSTRQLAKCAQVIQEEERVARDGVASFMAGHADAVGSDLIRAYRITVQGLKTDMVDAEEKGASPAVNNQSLVFFLEYQDEKVLFNGDMQFSAAQTAGLDDLMKQLRAVVGHEAPYSLAKLPHHGSYNGSDDAFFDETEATYWGMCAGEGDPGHPHSKILQILEPRRGSLHWGRTDRNGLVTFSFSGGRWAMTVERGEPDSLESNVASDAGTSAPPPAAAGPLEVPAPAVAPPIAPAVGTVQVVPHDREMVEVTARIPHVATDVTITISVRPQEVADTRPFDAAGGGSGAQVVGPPAVRLGGGRILPRLLFATSSRSLAAKLNDPRAVTAILAALKVDPKKHVVVDVPAGFSATAAAKAVTDELRRSAVEGVVLLGGYDILPPFRLDVLPADLRAKVSPKTLANDDDRFCVWSDSLYADLDGDRIEEFPVSRIPDGGSAALLVKTLSATWRVGAGWKGVRNVKRPFADYVLRKHAPAAVLLRSEKTVASSDLDLAAEQAYLMLHGATSDGTQFWGETIDPATGHTTGYPVAFNLACVPKHPPSVVFTGCCWGALTADPIAWRASDVTRLIPRTSANSIALKYLEAGALAFVGCTGAHYSPTPPGTFYGGPLHDGFWNYLKSGNAPARSLYKAKRDYMARIPHGPDDPDSVAIERKILGEFTCLGLGW